GTTAGTPIVIADDTYESVGNMTLDTTGLGSCGANAAFSVLCNDTATAATVSAFGNSQGTAGGTVANGLNTVSTTHGTVKLFPNGSIVYNPTAGFSGTDTFWYTLASGSLTGAAQVSINVGGANGMVWFVNSTGAAGSRPTSSSGRVRACRRRCG